MPPSRPGNSGEEILANTDLTRVFGQGIGRKTTEPVHNFGDQAQKNEKKFFIWYSDFLPHAPQDAPNKLYQNYNDLGPNGTQLSALFVDFR